MIVSILFCLSDTAIRAAETETIDGVVQGKYRMNEERAKQGYIVHEAKIVEPKEEFDFT